MSERHVRVERNRIGPRKAEQPWLVTCDLCPASGVGFPALRSLFGMGAVKGWAPDWQTAQDYAQRHALRHEQSRCPTCLHVPEQEIADERTSA